MFSVIIPSANAANLVPCINSILGRDPAIKPNQIIVIDDGAKEEAYRKLPIGIQWVEGVKPFCFSRNINLGIDAAGTNDVILCNDDIILKSQHGFTALARAIQNYDIVSAVTNSVGNVNQFPRGGGTIRFEKRVLAFVCVGLSRHIINTVGRLDERYTSYGGDDNDYCRRAILAGFKLAIFDACYVDHMKLTSTFRGKNKPGDFSNSRRFFEEKWGCKMEDIPSVGVSNNAHNV